MVRPVTNLDIGLKVLSETSEDAGQTIDIVAVHGVGAHPDDSWCTNVGTPKSPQWVNWLHKEDMLPAVAKNARIMRYGYQSQWFGEGAMRQNSSTVAKRLLLALVRARKGHVSRPLIFIGHCFGGLVILKALLDAVHDEKEYPGIYKSTTGLMFFGTPFRGAEGLDLMEMLDAAKREYHSDQIHPHPLNVLEPGNEFLQDVVDQFGKRRANDAHKAQVVCFYELKSTNVGAIVGKERRTRFVVSESSGCLDQSEATRKFSLSRTHFDMNKFGHPTEEDFETVRDAIEKIISVSHELVEARTRTKRDCGSKTTGDDDKFKVNFSLRGIPVVEKHVPRDSELRELDRLLVSAYRTNQRKVVVLHGLGGIGKTQLAVEFARQHKQRFSGIFWLDGSSKASLKRSFEDMAQRLPRDDFFADGVELHERSMVDADIAVRDCLKWLFLPLNDKWLLILDNVDRDHHDKDDSQAYNVEDYFPHADHGSILITSRIENLQEHGSGLKVGIVTTEQASKILENTAGKVVEDADTLLERLGGLPLALTQAGSYMRQTKMSAPEYAKHYDKMFYRLMKNQGRFPQPGYNDRNILTTWTISYEQARKQSETAAWMLKLWGFLDSGELWYDLFKTVLDNAGAEHQLPPWFVQIAEDELEFTETMRILSRYSLADAKHDTRSYSMHAVLHKWCRQLVEGDDDGRLRYMAAFIVATYIHKPGQLPAAESLVYVSLDSQLWKRRRLVLGHAMSVHGWVAEASLEKQVEPSGTNIPPWVFCHIATALQAMGRFQEAEEMYRHGLRDLNRQTPPHHDPSNIFHRLAFLYADQGRLDEAKNMYTQALKMHVVAETADTGIFHARRNLAAFYFKKGRLDEAEKLYTEPLSLQEYEEAIGAGNLPGDSALNELGILYANQGKVDKAEKMFKMALQGYQYGPGVILHANNLSKFYLSLGRLDEAEATLGEAWQRCEKVFNSEDISINPAALVTMWNIGSLCYKKGLLLDTRAWIKRSLSGYERAFGNDHPTCHELRCNLIEVDSQLYWKCDGCEKELIAGVVRYNCLDCPDFDFCSTCFKDAGSTHPPHRFEAVFVRCNMPLRPSFKGIKQE